MQRTITVRGHLVSPRRIELDESVGDIVGDVEVVVRAVAPDERSRRDVFDVVAAMQAGTRQKEAIDQQLAEERASWGDR